MLWILAVLIGLAYTFFKLGSISVWLGLLTVSLKFAFLVIVLLAIALAWQKIKASRNKPKTS